MFVAILCTIVIWLINKFEIWSMMGENKKIGITVLVIFAAFAFLNAIA